MSCCKNNGTFLTRSWDNNCCGSSNKSNNCCCNNSSNQSNCCNNSSNQSNCCCNNSSNQSNYCCNNSSNHSNYCCNNSSNQSNCCNNSYNDCCDNSYNNCCNQGISCPNVNNNDCACQNSLREVACQLTNQRVIIHIEGCKMCVVIVSIGNCFLKAVNPCTHKVVYFNLNRIDNIEDVLPRCNY